MKATFRKVILYIRLQKSYLKKIFHYAYKYKIAIYTSDLPFHQSDNFKIAIATSFYSTETLLLSTGSLGYTWY